MKICEIRTYYENKMKDISKIFCMKTYGLDSSPFSLQLSSNKMLCIYLDIQIFVGIGTGVIEL